MSTYLILSVMKLCGGQRGRESFCSLLVMRVCVFGTVCDVTVRQGERQREREADSFYLLLVMRVCVFGTVCDLSLIHI